MIQWPMTSTRKYLFVGSLILLTIAVTLFAHSGAADGTLRIFDWSDPSAAYKENGPAESGLPFTLTNDRYYTSIVTGAVPERVDKLPIAVLNVLPQATGDVAIYETPAMQSAPPNAFLYLRAVVRYRFNGQDIYLSTSQPLPIGGEKSVSIGRLRETTGDGRSLYIASEVRRQGANREIVHTFNQVSFVENGLIVTLAGELPQDELVTLIKTVTFTGR